MATSTKRKIKKVNQLDPNEIDEKILELLLKKEELKDLTNEFKKNKKTFTDRIKELKVLLESQYIWPAQREEIVHGYETLMKKIPVNQGRNSFDHKTLKPFLDAIDEYDNVVTKKVTTTYEVDTKALKKLIKNGKLPESVLDKARKDKWTFKSDFKRVEKVCQKDDDAS